ncbi:MAG: ACP S-malonyltransferase [Chromatiales bacterium]|nr:ACP S-malonyltransferase [Chromatiales bacterium]
MTSESQAKLAFVFPGQGSQSVGMLDALRSASPTVENTFAEASEALGFDLGALVRNGPAEDLNRTENTQPAMLTAGVAIWREWRERGGAVPGSMAGHSLGEYTALVCAGALEFVTAVKLVAERGRLMQQAVPEGQGAMAAILGLSDDGVRELCHNSAQGEVCQPVNFNAPGQIVIAGTASAVQRALDSARDAGAKRALRLPVSVPSHCSLMESAAERLADRLAATEFTKPKIRVLHNADVSAAGDADAIRKRLAEQLHKPVRWVEIIRQIAASGVRNVVECGPGKVLIGLNKRIEPELAAHAIFDPDSVKETIEAIANA